MRLSLDVDFDRLQYVFYPSFLFLTQLVCQAHVSPCIFNEGNYHM